MWWGPLTNQKPPRAIDQSQLLCTPMGCRGVRGGAHGGVHRGAWKGHKGVFVHGYYWLPLGTIDLVADNREHGCLRHILRYYILYM